MNSLELKEVINKLNLNIDYEKNTHLLITDDIIIDFKIGYAELGIYNLIPFDLKKRINSYLNNNYYGITISQNIFPVYRIDNKEGLIAVILEIEDFLNLKKSEISQLDTIIANINRKLFKKIKLSNTTFEMIRNIKNNTILENYVTDSKQIIERKELRSLLSIFDETVNPFINNVIFNINNIKDFQKKVIFDINVLDNSTDGRDNYDKYIYYTIKSVNNDKSYISFNSTRNNSQFDYCQRLNDSKEIKITHSYKNPVYYEKFDYKGEILSIEFNEVIRNYDFKENKIEIIDKFNNTIKRDINDKDIKKCYGFLNFAVINAKSITLDNMIIEQEEPIKKLTKKQIFNFAFFVN